MKKHLLSIVLLVLLLISVAVNFFEYQRYSSRRPVIRMNGDNVTRKEYQDKLDHDFGKQVLNKIVYAKIIADAAKKAGVAPTDKDIDERLAEINRRNPQLISGAKADPEVMAALRVDLAEDIGLENLRIKDINVSDSDVETFYKQNPGAFSLPPQVQTTIVAAQNDVDAATAKGMMQQGMNTAQISRQPRLSVVGVGGFSLSNASPQLKGEIAKAVSTLKDGEIATIKVGPAFLVIRADSHSPSGVPPFVTVKPIATRIYKLGKGESAEVTLARLFRDANVQFEVAKYAPMFQEMEDATKKLSVNAPTPSK